MCEDMVERVMRGSSTGFVALDFLIAFLVIPVDVGPLESPEDMTGDKGDER